MEKKTVFLSIVMGFVLGVGMAVIMLWALQQIQFSFASLSFVFLVIIACALPECVNRLEQRGFYVKQVKVVMILVSYGIAMLYGFVITSKVAYVSSTLKDMCLTTSLVHGISLVYCLISGRRKHE